MGSGSYKKIEDTTVYLRFRAVAKEIWFEAIGWDWFAKRTVAEQLVTSADSIPANLSEGDGRYSDGEAIHFFYIARASARELLNWISVAAERNLVTPELAQRWEAEINGATQELNNLINFRKANKNIRAVREERSDYGPNVDEA